MKPLAKPLLRWIPNALTVSRALLCPLVVYFFLTSQLLAGLALFTTCCFTDYLDGYLARRWNARTELGTLLDPICDKLFALSFFSVLMVLGACPAWFLAFLISVILLQIIGFLILRVPKAKASFSIRPLRIAKWNTATQFLWIGVLFSDQLLRLRFPENFRYSYAFHFGGYLFLTVFQAVVFFRYFVRSRTVLLPDFRWLAPANP